MNVLLKTVNSGLLLMLVGQLRCGELSPAKSKQDKCYVNCFGVSVLSASQLLVVIRYSTNDRSNNNNNYYCYLQLEFVTTIYIYFDEKTLLH